MHNSGKRQTFDTGAVRDAAEDKPRVVLLSPFALRRVGEVLRMGEIKYAARNWEKGIPIERCVDSLFRHLLAYMAGETDEDHMAHLMCNAMFVMHTEEMVNRGVLPGELLDMPNYQGE